MTLVRAKKILLFVCNDRLLAYGWRGRQLALFGRYAADAHGRSDFAAMVAAHARVPFYLLLDVVEEDFHTETVPHVLGKDHAALLRRKLQQYFRGGHYVNAWVQGREEEGRRDDRVLLSGLLTNDLLDGWLDILDQYRAPLATICSIALLSVSIVKRFYPDSEHVLLVTEDSDSGIRQSYFRNGDLKFSRLTALPGCDEGELAPKIMSESRRTRQYLASLRLVARDDPVTTLVLCHAAKRERLQRECHGGDGLEFQFLALEDVAGAFRMKPRSNLSVAELMLHLIGQRQWRNHYAPSKRRSNYRLWLSGRMLNAAAALVLLVGVGVAGWLMQQSADVEASTASLNSKALQAERLKRANLLPASDMPAPAILKQAVERIAAAQQNWPSLSQRLLQLSGLFDRYPQLTLDSLSWGVSANEELLSDAADSAAPKAPEEGADAGTEPAPVKKRNEIIRLQGRVNPFTDNYRFAIDSVERFSKDWERLAGQPVRRVKVPLYTRPDKPIDMEQQGGAEEPDKTDYELLLVRPLLPGAK